MSTQKDKFALFGCLQSLGFTYEESAQLRRIEMTLHRWAELECGDSNDFKSWCISRDEKTGKPVMEVHPHDGKSYTYPIADRERGALKRLARIVAARNARQADSKIIPYHQSDPRGCQLYLVNATDITPATPIDSIYNRGLAVCA